MNVSEGSSENVSVVRDMPSHMACPNDVDDFDSRVFMYAIDENDRICSINSAWREFSIENGDVELSDDRVIGQCIWDFIVGDDARRLYGLFFQCVRSHHRAITIPFRCDSPDMARLMRMTMLPHSNRAIGFRCSILSMKPKRREEIETVVMQNDDAVMELCSFCNRARVQPGYWIDPEFAISIRSSQGQSLTPQISHSVCVDCVPEMKRWLTRTNRHNADSRTALTD